MSDVPKYDYPPPVDKLLTLGEAAFLSRWDNYARHGFGPDHIPDLIRLATDQALLEEDSEKPEASAPVHAWRVLAQMRTEAVLGPMLELLDRAGEAPYEGWSEAVWEDAPQVFGLVGPPAIPALKTYLAGKSHHLYARSAAADGLTHIAIEFPETRGECVQGLMEALEHFEEEDLDFNGTLVVDLCQLKAKEAAPLVERAFLAGCVDTFLIGWQDAQQPLGLPDPPEELYPPYEPARSASPSSQSKKKAKRKQAQKSRKQNRRKKRK
ncbi:MAG: DUF1186 domain-containing protein [Anaerolineae bacterium]|nr:DUF1186 domain-containing protein [Anaerolineae bacterium]